MANRTVIIQSTKQPLTMTERLAAQLKKSVGKKNSMSKDEVMEIVFPEKVSLIYSQNRSFYQNLEVKEMWMKCKGVMRSLRQRIDTFIMSSNVGRGEFVYHLVSNRQEAAEFSERLNKIMKGMERSRKRCFQAIDNRIK